MSNYSSTASASLRLPPSIFDLAAQFQAKRNVAPSALTMAGQSVTATATTSAITFAADPQPAANEAVVWDAEAWLSAFDLALATDDGDQQDALAVHAKQAMEDAQRRGDKVCVQSIQSAAKQARTAREDSLQQTEDDVQEGPVPNVEAPFGTNAASLLVAPVGQSQQVTPQPSGRQPKTGDIDLESREILRYISEDFVLLTSGGKVVAYHIESGDTFCKEGMRQHCAKHYGSIQILAADKDGSMAWKQAPAGDVWWQWNEPDRRVVRRIVMEPTSKAAFQDADDCPDVFNRWHQLKITMAERNPAATAQDVTILTNHLMYLAGGDVVGVTFFLCWLAQLYQTPEIKMPTAVLLYSQQGRVGKNLLGRLISKVFGAPLVLTSGSSKILTSKFNDSILHKRIIFINEVRIGPKDKDAVEEFKNTISEPTMQFEGKGVASKEIKNIAHYIITSNHADALPLMEKDGRIAVLRCLAERQSDQYYKDLIDWIDGPGAPALAQVLATWVFPKDWDPYAPVPQTEAARAMQKAARGHGIYWLEERVAGREGPFAKQIVRCQSIFIQLAAIPTYESTMKAYGISPQTLPGMLSKLGFKQLFKPDKEGRPSTNPNRKCWCSDNPDWWDQRPDTVWTDYIKDGIAPEGMPPFESDNDG
ncbi:primase-helicase family protein [Pseudomonas sp. P2758]|uniref:primase-helicase family protein n=1 Tax=Pseudomonas sp. P2758 TaxID=3409916 RepID=UPI003B5AB298